MAYKIVDVEQNTSEWLSFRKGKIGASMVAAIMGIDPYTTPRQLWGRVIRNEQVEVTSAMKRGKDLEPVALERFNFSFIKGEPIFTPTVVQDCENEDLIASLDGFRVWEGKTEVLEIKHPRKEYHYLASTGHVPAHYYPQIQMQMHLTHADRGIYLSGNGEGEYAVVEIFRDESYIEKMMERVLEFLECLYNFKEPKELERDVVEIYDEQKIQDAIRIISLNQQINDLKKEQDDLRNRLLDGIDYQIAKAGNVMISKEVRKGSIEYDKIPQLEGVNLEKYRKPSTEYYKISKCTEGLRETLNQRRTMSNFSES